MMDAVIIPPVESLIIQRMVAGRFAEAHALIDTLLPAERDRLAAGCRNTLAILEGTAAPVMASGLRTDGSGGQTWHEHRNGPLGVPQTRGIEASAWRPDCQDHQ